MLHINTTILCLLLSISVAQGILISSICSLGCATALGLCITAGTATGPIAPAAYAACMSTFSGCLSLCALLAPAP